MIRSLTNFGNNFIEQSEECDALVQHMSRREHLYDAGRMAQDRERDPHEIRLGPQQKVKDVEETIDELKAPKKKPRRIKRDKDVTDANQQDLKKRNIS